jgi:2-polyprenyl-3-methyl-5-hydroxy-6-metoxy-1,4-benzoquinol methylase
MDVFKMIDLQYIAEHIKKNSDGIYYSVNATPVSYPDDGNQNFMLIEENSFWFQHRNNIIVALVKKYNSGKTFFDIGGGNGFVAKGIQEAGEEVVIVEPGQLGALNAAKRNIKHVICATLSDAGFKPNSMDGVGLFDVVEHIEDDVAFLREVHAYVRPGGHVFITVPAFKALWSNEDDHAGHYRRYTRKELEDVLVSSGFEIAYSTYFFSILPLPVFFFRSIPSRLGLSKKAGSLEKNQEEHAVRKGIMSKILDKIWSWEMRKITRGEKISVGGSCLVVAKKK